MAPYSFHHATIKCACGHCTLCKLKRSLANERPSISAPIFQEPLIAPRTVTFRGPLTSHSLSAKELEWVKKAATSGSLSDKELSYINKLSGAGLAENTQSCKSNSKARQILGIDGTSSPPQLPSLMENPLHSQNKTIPVKSRAGVPALTDAEMPRSSLPYHDTSAACSDSIKAWLAGPLLIKTASREIYPLEHSLSIHVKKDRHADSIILGADSKGKTRSVESLLNISPLTIDPKVSEASFQAKDLTVSSAPSVTVGSIFARRRHGVSPAAHPVVRLPPAYPYRIQHLMTGNAENEVPSIISAAANSSEDLPPHLLRPILELLEGSTSLGSPTSDRSPVSSPASFVTAIGLNTDSQELSTLIDSRGADKRPEEFRYDEHDSFLTMLDGKVCVARQVASQIGRRIDGTPVKFVVREPGQYGAIRSSIPQQSPTFVAPRRASASLPIMDPVTGRIVDFGTDDHQDAMSED
ncbi:hypothetical protein FH972_023375 [Carpinus fangiana]|uniref:Uncharacterized protein n=1 Tax=Carpinus fangiana TaxID=176857 RepID=A0A5N6KVC5_9ROSI|nr:hypothetical protein FH972_023375 [Carpinus fangiana]